MFGILLEIQNDSSTSSSAHIPLSALWKMSPYTPKTTIKAYLFQLQLSGYIVAHLDVELSSLHDQIRVGLTTRGCGLCSVLIHGGDGSQFTDLISSEEIIQYRKDVARESMRPMEVAVTPSLSNDEEVKQLIKRLGEFRKFAEENPLVLTILEESVDIVMAQMRKDLASGDVSRWT